jgi:tRNA(Ile)-lysidine synthase
MPDAGTLSLENSELDRLFEPFAGFDHLLLAVSGGVDSMALMVLVAEWQNDRGMVGDIRVVTVDHALRPEAAAEAKAVAQAATKLGLPAEILTWQGPVPQSGIQAAARALRYELLLGRAIELCQGTGKAALVTAHHMDDLAETVLMRLARGAGVDGLSAMQGIGQHRSGVAIVRPFLDVPKSRLKATLVARGHEWIEDPSNLNPKFERVRLREAEAARVALGLTTGALNRTARRMVRARTALEGIVDKVMAPRLSEFRLTQFGVYVWPAQLSELPDEIGIRLLMRVLKAVGGREEQIRLSKVERLYGRLTDPVFAGVTLGNCILEPIGAAASEQKGIAIYREPGRSGLPTIETDLASPVVWDNRFEVTASVPLQGKIIIRPLVRRDLSVLGNDICDDYPDIPYKAWLATPVVELENGIVWHPALNVHEGALSSQLDTVLSCRFLTERLGKV